MKAVNQILITVVLVALLGLGIFFGVQQIRQGGGKGTRQAIFLTNGQVYFGYASGLGSKYIKLKDIYYLQVQDPIQPAKDNATQQPQVSLVKLGNELHGPKDEMKINRDQVLFVEDMKNESKVNEAIANYVKNGAQATPTPTPTK
jgi:hypothetical protein